MTRCSANLSPSPTVGEGERAIESKLGFAIYRPALPQPLSLKRRGELTQKTAEGGNHETTRIT